MKVLVVGGGGREDVLTWKIAQDSTKPELFCAPGNAGTARYATNLDIAAEDVDGIVAWAKDARPDLTVVGPEAPLCLGLVDMLEAEGLTCFGPRKDAARIEGSKVFCKDILDSAGIPTGASANFTDAAAAIAYIKDVGAPIVVKAEGLAAGKGVTVAMTEEDAIAAVNECLEDGAFGEAGACVLIEEYLDGEEASILALVDGERAVLLASSQDHKRAYEGDEGPNTGGMGAYSPAPVVTDQLLAEIERVVIQPTLAEMKQRGIDYRGVLYAGIMVTADGPKVLEYNARFGDPETQAVLRRLDSDLVPVLLACAKGELDPDMLTWSQDPSVCVVMASGGYPGSYPKGLPISGLADADAVDSAVVFHAGTSLDGETVLTAGGRVLNITARGATLEQALERAYQAVDAIHFDGAHVRRDIAHRALNRNL